MATEPQVESANGSPKSLCSKVVIKVAFVALLLALVVLIAGFQWIQREFSYETLQGYWNITGNTYLLISDKLVQFIEFGADGTHEVLYEETNAEFKYMSVLARSKHKYTFTKSTNKQFAIPGSATNPFNAKTISLVLYPVIGAMQLMKDGKEVARLMKDNQMSIEYLSS